MRWNRTTIGVLTAAALLGTVFAAGLSVANETDDHHVRVDHGEWTGFLSCSVSFPTAPFPSRCPGLVDPNRDDRHEFEVDEDLRTIVVAMVWDPAPTNTEEDLRNWLYSEEAGAHVVRAKGPSPLEYRYDLDADADAQEFMFRIGSGSGSLSDVPTVYTNNFGVAYQQEFTVYWDLYYGEPAPEDASALPDH